MNSAGFGPIVSPLMLGRAKRAKGGSSPKHEKHGLNLMIVLPMGSTGHEADQQARPVTQADIPWAQQMAGQQGHVGSGAHPFVIGQAMRRMLAQPNLFTMLRTQHALIGGINGGHKMAVAFFRQDGQATDDELAELVGGLADRARGHGAGELVMLPPSSNPALASLQPIFHKLGATTGQNGSETLPLTGTQQ